MQVNKKNIFLKINDFCYLRVLTKDDISEEYVLWMNDNEVVKYTEQRYIKHHKNNVKEFVNQKFYSNKDFLMGIFFEDKHIGNIKLGPIKWEHKSSEISFFIGNKEYWGRGIASLIVSKVVDFGINVLELKKINAGYYESNIVSAKVFNRCGFSIEGKRLSEVIFEGKRENYILVGYTNF